MTGYVLAHRGDEAERRRLELLHAFHGPLTERAALAAGVAEGWRCLEAGAGGGGMTRWLADQVGPTGRVVAVDLETDWLEPLRSDVVEVRREDLTIAALPAGFDLVVARMLLLHLRDPAAMCARLVGAARRGGQVVLQDADFSTVALEAATDAEAAGLGVMASTMRAAGVHLALGPELPALVRAAGAHVAHVEASPSPGRGGGAAARITAITLQRFRDQATARGASGAAIDAVLGALADPDRGFTGPTQWIVRAVA